MKLNETKQNKTRQNKTIQNITIDPEGGLKDPHSYLLAFWNFFIFMALSINVDPISTEWVITNHAEQKKILKIFVQRQISLKF